MPPRGGLGRQRPTKFCNQMGGEILSRKERNQKAHTENGNGKKDRKTSVDTKERDELRERLARDGLRRLDRDEDRKKDEKVLKKKQAEQEEEKNELLQQQELLCKQQSELEVNFQKKQEELFQKQQQLEEVLTNHKQQQLVNQKQLDHQQQQNQEHLHQQQKALTQYEDELCLKQQQQEQQLSHQVKKQQEIQQQQQQQLDQQVQQQQDKHIQQQQQLEHQVQQQHQNQQHSQELLNQQQQELLQYKADLQQKQEQILIQQQQLEQQHSKEKAVEDESLRRRRCQLEEDQRQQQQEQSRIQQNLQLQQVSLEEKQQLLQHQLNVELEKGKLDQQQQQQRREEIKKQEDDLEHQRLQLQRQQEDEMEKGRKELQCLRNKLDMEFEQQKLRSHQLQQQQEKEKEQGRKELLQLQRELGKEFEQQQQEDQKSKLDLELQEGKLRQQQQKLQLQQSSLRQQTHAVSQPPVYYMQHQPYAPMHQRQPYPPVLPQQQGIEQLRLELQKEREEKGELRKLLMELQTQLKELRQELASSRAQRSEEVNEVVVAPSQPPLGIANLVNGLTYSRSYGLTTDESKVRSAVQRNCTSEWESLEKKAMQSMKAVEKARRLWEKTNKKEREVLNSWSLREVDWNIPVTKFEEVSKGNQGVALATPSEARDLLGMKPEVPAWKTCSVVTLDQVNGQGRREHVLLSSKDGNKVHRIFIHDLGEAALPKGKRGIKSVKAIVTAPKRRWKDDKWLELASKPEHLITKEMKDTPGFMEAYNFRVTKSTVSAVIRLRKSGAVELLRTSGKDGRFLWIQDEGEAPKDTVIWLQDECSLKEAVEHSDSLESLGLVENPKGFGIRVSPELEDVTREKLGIPAKLPELEISGIPLDVLPREAVALLAKDGWHVRATVDGVRTGYRWMRVRAEVPDDDTVLIDGRACTVEVVQRQDRKKRQAAREVDVKEKTQPTSTAESTPEKGLTPPEKRRDPTEGEASNRCYLRAEFLSFHGKGKGKRLWREAGVKIEERKGALKEVGPVEQVVTKKTVKKSTAEQDTMERRMDRLEMLMTRFLEGK